eukprot:sb/3466776/
MTRIRNELLLKCLGHVSRRSDESLSQFLRRITHVHLQDKNISVIENLQDCSSLSVLYLYDNRIEKIENLTFATSLTHLYLQNNSITKLEGLHRCPNLSKLYLGFNNIIVIENLEKCISLKELHVENQQLPQGEKMLFDPRTLMCLSGSLMVLNISNNSIDSIKDLACLKSLTQLYSKNNKLASLKELSRVFGSLPALWKLELDGNPVCRKPKFRDRIIVMTSSLAMLDGKEITDTSRRFLHNWRVMKDNRKKQLESDQLTTGDQDTAGLPPIGNRNSMLENRRIDRGDPTENRRMVYGSAGSSGGSYETENNNRNNNSQQYLM